MWITDKFIHWAAKKAFKAVDMDSNGKLDVKELYICVLLIYDAINRRLPTPLAPPTLKEVKDDYLKKFDTNQDGTLSYEEFVPIVRMIVFREKDWKESVVAKYSWAMTLKLVLVPLVAGHLSSILIARDSAHADKAPGIMTAVLDMISKYTLLF